MQIHFIYICFVLLTYYDRDIADFHQKLAASNEDKQAKKKKKPSGKKSSVVPAHMPDSSK